MTNDQLTQKDLDLVDEENAGPGTDDTSAETTEQGAKGADAKSEDGKGEAKSVDEKAAEKAKSVSVLDDLGDDDAEAQPDPDKDKAKAEESKSDDGETDDKDGDQSEDDKAEESEAKWRERIVEKILAPLKDQLTASKLEKREKALMNELKRSKSLDDAIIRGIAAQDKLRSGQYKQKLSEDASEEEVAAWRKENGLPEKPDAYDIPKVPGHEWTEKDQPLLDEFKQVAHKRNLDQGTVDELVRWQVQQQQKIEEDMEETLAQVDKEDREACHDAIRTQYGVSEFKPHMKLMERLLKDDEIFSDEAGTKLIGARYYDTDSGTWRRVTSDPGVANALITLAKYEYGDGAMVSGDARVKSQDRIKEIEDIRSNDINRYYREGLADELLELKRKEQATTQRRTRAA